MLPRRAPFATCLALVVALGVAGCGEEEAAPPGQVIAAQGDEQLTDGTRATLLVPTGILQVFTGDAVDTLAPDETRERREYDAPAGTAYVPIAWRLRAGRFGKVADYVDTEAVPVVDLLVGEDSYRLPPPNRNGEFRSFYVLADEAPDARLRVTFDGVAQSLDLRTGDREPGEARALYRLPKKLAPDTSRCSDAAEFDLPRGVAEYDCRLTGPLLLPYAAGAWAPAGSQWLVVDLRTTLTRMAQAAPTGGGGAYWAADEVTTTLRAGGEGPETVRSLRIPAGECPTATTKECGYAAIATFEVADDPPEALEVTHEYHLLRGPTYGGFTPKRQRTVTATATLGLD
ncbi:hypothetical protein KUV85_10915 [Nocardioides panacisoli]|uniref:hypothetical protein n=1 Tax=Nocardioides panacisoli TaxID=627624 RepID=UPI001C638ECC|nr:hypothetical protein [Nocardioides panacisoli]QYJ02845.1 hypothetical protein KUV85_10915 [Nocardioides panacisoli]